MALIVLPSIEASGRPSPGDCMSAEAAILQQVGGVGPIAAKIVAGVNDYIDFTVGGGGELSARIAAGVYLSVAALLAACKTAMETAAAGAIVVTTTVQADRVVVTSSTAIAIKFSTGTHAAISARDLLGFGTIDTANGPTHTAAAPVPMELYAFAGGLDAANIAASAGFTNRHKREPWARSTVNIPITRFSGVPAVPTSACVPVNFMVERVVLTEQPSVAVDFKGVIEFFSDSGAVLFALRTEQAIGASAAGVLVAASSYVGEWILRRFLQAGTWLRPVVTADAGYSAWAGEIVFYGKALHV